MRNHENRGRFNAKTQRRGVIHLTMKNMKSMKRIQGKVERKDAKDAKGKNSQRIAAGTPAIIR